MKCRTFRLQIHEFLDERLPGQDISSMEAHLLHCFRCAEFHREYIVLRQMLAQRAHFPDSAARTVIASIHRKREGWFRQAWDGLVGGWQQCRDWDWGVLLSRSAAAPFALVLFLFVFLQFVPPRSEPLSFVLIPVSPTSSPVHAIISVQSRSDRGELRELMDTAWRLPYEDSLALVAEVQSEGQVEIDSVLEYPKSSDLLNAVHAALRASQLSRGRTGTNRLLIFSFQKIDVYENEQGL